MDTWNANKSMHRAEGRETCEVGCCTTVAYNQAVAAPKSSVGVTERAKNRTHAKCVCVRESGWFGLVWFVLLLLHTRMQQTEQQVLTCQPYSFERYESTNYAQGKKKEKTRNMPPPRKTRHCLPAPQTRLWTPTPRPWWSGCEPSCCG